MAEESTSETGNNPDTALMECRGALRSGIRGVKVDEEALAKFSEEFVATFNKRLTGPKALPWNRVKAHVLYLAWVMGVLAEFYAVAAPPKRETVGRKHLLKAFKTIKADCLDTGKRDPERFYMCPPTISM